MKILFLGCGTSTGVPLIGCKCKVCTSKNIKNQRTRASLLVEYNQKNILVDTSPDLRFQALTNKIEQIDAVLYTHTHADHIHGIDELRSFNFIQLSEIPCYGSEETINQIRQIFPYIFNDSFSGGGKPILQLHIVSSKFNLYGLDIVPIKILHGNQTIFAYKFGSVAYLSDCSGIPEDSKPLLKDLKLLILDALRYQFHPTHFNLEGALKVVEELKPQRAIFTHMGHQLDYEEVNRDLPEGTKLAYDGMVVEI